MTRSDVIEAIRHAHPWVSVERCEDLMDAAAAQLHPHALPMELGRQVLRHLEIVEWVGSR